MTPPDPRIRSEISLLREIVRTYGDRFRMANAPAHLQQAIDAAMAGKEPSGRDLVQEHPEPTDAEAHLRRLSTLEAENERLRAALVSAVNIAGEASSRVGRGSLGHAGGKNPPRAGGPSASLPRRHRRHSRRSLWRTEMILPAISLWQPWGSLLFVPGAKVHETRHWPAPQRLVGKRMLVHAAKTKQGIRDMDGEFDQFELPDPLPLGAFIGLVTLGKPFPMRADISRYGARDLKDQLCGNWSPGRWAWPIHDAHPFAEPIPAKGQQGFWTAEIEDPK